MKPSQIFTGISSIVEKIANIGGLLHMVSPFVGIIKGNEPAGDATPLVKGLYGVFGYADERAFEVLLNGLKSAGSREKIEKFLQWHFKTGTWTEIGLTLYYGNKFRTFVTKMGSKEGSLEETIEVTVTAPDQAAKGKSTKAVTKKEIRGKGTNHAHDFLEMMADALSNPPTEEECEQLLLRLKTLNYPHIPRWAEGTIEKIVEATIAYGPVAHAKTIEGLTKAVNAVNSQKKGLTAFERFISKI